MYFSSAATACSTALSFLQLAAVAVPLLTFSSSKLRKLLEKDNPLLADLPQGREVKRNECWRQDEKTEARSQPT
jgi:hypothetical protein